MPFAHRPALRTTLTFVLVAAAALAILRIARADASAIDLSSLTLRPGRLVAGTLAEVALLGWGVALWSLVLGRFDGPRPPFGSMLRAWFGTNLAKYVPGGIWPVVTTAGMASRMGVCPLALSASFLLHATFTVLGALAVAAVLVSPAQLRGGGVSLAGVAVLLPLALLLVHPRVLERLLAGAARVARRPAAPWRGRWVDGVGLLALYAATWVGYGFAFFLFVSSITPVRGATWPVLAGVNALAFVAGFVAVFAPGGIGVREAALAVLLLPVVPGKGRVLVAASSRLWLVGTELLGGGLALMVPRGARRWRSSPRPAAPPAPAPRPPAPGVTRGNEVEVLTNTAAALGRIAAACRRAQRSVWIAQLAFDADCLSAAGDGDEPSLLVDALLAAAAGDNGGAGADVRILLNGSILMNTAPALRRHFAQAGADPARLVVRGVDRFPGIMHAKLVVVDGAEAFLVGSPFVNGYWDDGAHRASQPGRTEEDLGGRPIHDVSVQLRGPAVADLAGWFAEVWNGTPPGPEAPSAPLVPSAAAARGAGSGGTSVRVARTLPPGAVPGRAQGATEILDAYVDAIGRARSLVYLENQYFSAPPIRRALSAALQARPELEVVLVMNQNPDITAYRAWQNRRLAEGGLLNHPRVGVFSLWAASGSPGVRGVELTQLFIHSKTAVVDDAWATLGTANLDGVSLHSYGDDFSARPWRRLFRGIRNFDLNLELLSGAGGEADGGAAAGLRRRLWAAHLGMDEDALRERPAEGWLSLWRAAAAQNAERLARGRVPRGHVLPYALAPRPRGQLRALGIDVDAAEIDLRFDPGWVEVMWSPGWAKKVIPEPVRRKFARRARTPAPPRAPARGHAPNPVPARTAARLRAEFQAFVDDPAFSCLGARAALHHPARGFGAYAGMATPQATRALARDLAAFARDHAGQDFATFVAVFADAPPADEAEFEARLWAQLRALHAADPAGAWDPAVSDDPADPRFSFSFAGHAFFVVGLHPESSRLARRFGWPVLVFNPHGQFQRLRQDGRYRRLRDAIRTREMALQGSLNPNLADFGAESEARQYSGRAVEADWACPFHRQSGDGTAAGRDPGAPDDGSAGADGGTAVPASRLEPPANP